jgi:hypothetical protein
VVQVHEITEFEIVNRSKMKDILWPHSEDFDVNPWMSTDFSAYRMKFSLGQSEKMWQCEAYTPNPSTMLKNPY